MSYLNYFEPYISKIARHEDQLTRAFLIVLRYSPLALFIFYDYMRSSLLGLARNEYISVEIPETSQIKGSNIRFWTQTGNLENARQFVSVLITDERIEISSDIKNSNRGAIYDGIISFSDELTLIIENKPKSENVWKEQLNPNLSKWIDEHKEHMDTTPQLVKVPAILEWKEIIKKLNEILLIDAVGGAEGLIISDFLDFINRNFPSLNPYDNLTLCKNNRELIEKRVKNILMSVSTEEALVDYHKGWTYYIKSDLPDIAKVGIEIGFDQDKLKGLWLSLYFGDTSSQAKSFYNRKIDYSKIEHLINEGWKCDPNFHLSHIRLGLVWLKTPEGSMQDYYSFWKENVNRIDQYGKEEIRTLLSELDRLKLIILKNDELDTQIFKTNRDRINVCPGLGLSYEYPAEKAKALDSMDNLIDDIKERIREGLGILETPIKFIK